MYHITNEISTVRAMAQEIADNGMTGDPRVSIEIGAIFGRDIKAGTIGAWANTNGDPVFLASYDDTGDLLYSALAEMPDDQRDEVLIDFGWAEPEDLDAAVAAYLEG